MGDRRVVPWTPQRSSRAIRAELGRRRHDGPSGAETRRRLSKRWAFDRSPQAPQRSGLHVRQSMVQGQVPPRLRWCVIGEAAPAEPQALRPPSAAPLWSPAPDGSDEEDLSSPRAAIPRSSNLPRRPTWIHVGSPRSPDECPQNAPRGSIFDDSALLHSPCAGFPEDNLGSGDHDDPLWGKAPDVHSCTDRQNRKKAMDFARICGTIPTSQTDQDQELKPKKFREN